LHPSTTDVDAPFEKTPQKFVRNQMRTLSIRGNQWIFKALAARGILALFVVGGGDEVSIVDAAEDEAEVSTRFEGGDEDRRMRGLAR